MKYTILFRACAGCLVLLVLLIARSACFGQFRVPSVSELRKNLVQLLNDGKQDEAVTLLRQKALDHPGSPDVADAMFMVARFQFGRDKFDESLALLKQITEQFGETTTADLAWCGLGQVYEKLGDSEKMISSLERGMSGRRILTETNIMDASDTHNYASQRLGEHYLKTAQWEKALKVYTDWRPSSWCGNCFEGMRETRTNSIVLCHAHLADFRSAVESVWREVASGNQSYDQLELFLLVRSYSEAGQLDDLHLMSVLLAEKASERSEANRDHPSFIRNATKALSSAIDNARQKDTLLHIQTLESENATPVSKHVARWVLLRNPKQSVPALKSAALKSQSPNGALLQLLAAIDTLGSRTVLVDLACTRDPYRMQAACNAIYHLKSSKELLAKVITRVPEQNRNLIHLDHDPVPFSREYRYYEPWPPPKSKSLPKSLPERLLDD